MLSGKLPLLGHALEFAKDRSGLFRRGYETLGNAFRIKLATQTAVVLIGPEFNTLFFKETDKSLDMAKPYAFLKSLIGDVAFAANHETYLQHRPVLYAPFQRDKMTRYIEVMDETVRKWLKNLPDEGRIELTEAMNLLVQEVAGRTLLGDDFMSKIGPEFWEDYTIIGKALDPLLPPNLPLPKFIRRDKARNRILDALRPILENRLKHPDAYDDYLQDFLTTAFADGSNPTIDEQLNMILALLFAGHETTAGQAAWTIIQLLQNPDYLAKVRTELDTEFPIGSKVGPKTMSKLKHLKWAIDETTRTKPSADIMIRVADKDLEAGGFFIPKGAAVFVSSEVSQSIEEIFPNPLSYDPERFDPAQCPHKGVKNAIIGFGGGMHKCPGMNFALNEMLTISALLLQSFDLTLETKDPQQRQDMGASRPTETWISFKRRPITKHEMPEGAEIPDSVKAMAIAAGCSHF